MKLFHHFLATFYVKTLLLLTLSLSSLAGHAMQQSTSLDGIWRGELAMGNGVFLPIGITISANNTQLSLHSPAQGMRDYLPSEFAIAHNHISFSDDKLRIEFDGKTQNGAIEGTFTQGKARPLVLHKLTENDLSRIPYEGKYSGNLVVNASLTLPLVVHVTVIKNGFSGALDSPSQTSLGIPITKLNIDQTSFSFTSPLIKASFSGTKNADGYTGNFIQGLPLPLTLSKVTENNVHMPYKTPEFGEHGGSLAVITPQKARLKHFGNHTVNTAYEIGSLSKTFTAYLLAKQIQTKQISMNTSLDIFFKDAPTASMQSLATHTSGIERNPPSILENYTPSNPFKNITRAQLEKDLSRTKRGKESFLYSNFAYGALGEALAKNVDSSYAKELQRNIFSLLSMDNSYVAVNEEQLHLTIAKGHKFDGSSVQPWSFNSMSGAGGIVATPSDMLKYTQHMMTLAIHEPELAEILLQSTIANGDCCQPALAWIISKDTRGKKYAWHNGMTGGFSAFLGFYLDGSKAVFVLNNQAVSVDKLGHKLLTENDIDLSTII